MASRFDTSISYISRDLLKSLWLSLILPPPCYLAYNLNYLSSMFQILLYSYNRWNYFLWKFLIFIPYSKMYILYPNDICLCYRWNFFIHFFNICWMNACHVEDNSQTQKCNRKIFKFSLLYMFQSSSHATGYSDMACDSKWLYRLKICL